MMDAYDIDGGFLQSTSYVCRIDSDGNPEIVFMNGENQWFDRTFACTEYGG